jgi:hypothetical protein
MRLPKDVIFYALTREAVAIETIAEPALRRGFLAAECGVSPKRSHPKAMNHSLPWMKYAPTSEQEVVVLFSLLLPHLPMRLELDEVREQFPDCLACRLNKDGTRTPVRIEFELFASNFIDHGHDPNGCDLIVCWEDDLAGFSVPRLPLRLLAETTSPPVIALPLRPKYEVKVWDRESFLAKCSDELRPLQNGLLNLAKQHGEVVFGKGRRNPSWKFDVPLNTGQRCTLFGVYANGTTWFYRMPDLSADRRARFEQCLQSAPGFKAALASGKAWFEVGIQEEGVLDALTAAIRAVAPQH